MSENLLIENSTQNFETWLNQSFISDDLREELRSSRLLLVPTIGFRDHSGPVFPPVTEELLLFLKKNLPKEVEVSICIADKDFKILSLHSDSQRIGNIIVDKVFYPVLVGVLIYFLTEMVMKKEEQQPVVNIVNVVNIENTNTSKVSKQAEISPQKKYHEPKKVKFNITVVDSNGASKEIKYDGPASEVKSTLEGLKEFWKDDSATNTDTIK